MYGDIMRKTVFIKNAAILTASSFLLRLLGIIFKIWVAAKVGGEGMGLFSLAVSVFTVFSAFAGTGLCTAATRLCANNLSMGLKIRPVIKKCLVLTAIISIVSSAVMLIFSRKLSVLSIGDSSLTLCFAVFSAALPAVGISSVFKGYFISSNKVKTNAVSQIGEQIIRIFLSYYLVTRFIKKGAAAACLALVIGDTVSEIFCAVFLFLKYKFSFADSEKVCDCSYKSILRISLPLTAGRYISLLLRTAENLLIPRTLYKFGAAKSEALSLLGSIKAMALPVLLFPAGMLNSVSLLLTPEISSSLVCKRYLVVKGITEQIIKITSVFSVYFACVFAVLGGSIGELLYKSESVGFLLTALSPIVPLMYLDSVSDGILKGLDCQKQSFFIGVSDSLLRVISVIIFLPKYGILAFIFIMYGSNFYTAFLNLAVLTKKSRAEINPVKTVFMPLCTAIVITKATEILLKPLAAFGIPLYLSAVCLGSFVMFVACLFLLGSITADDLKIN